MANVTDYFTWDTGATIYCKPRPLDDTAWGDDVVSYAESSVVNGEYAATVSDSEYYAIFIQAGGSPAEGDPEVGKIEPEGTITLDAEDVTQISDAVWAYSSRTLTGAAAASGGTVNTRTLTIVRNDSYDGVGQPALTVTVTKDYSGFTGEFTVRHRQTGVALINVSTVTVTSATVLTVTLTTSDTALAALLLDSEYGPHPFDIELTSGSSVASEKGVAILCKDVTT